MNIFTQIVSNQDTLPTDSFNVSPIPKSRVGVDSIVGVDSMVGEDSMIGVDSIVGEDSIVGVDSIVVESMVVVFNSSVGTSIVSLENVG